MSAIPRNSLDTSISPAAATSASMLKAAVLSVGKRISSVWNFWAYRSTMTQLVTLDDHMLRDIGITRCDVNAAATLPYSNDPTSRLRTLAQERQASELALAKEIRQRRKISAQRSMTSDCEPYRSTDQRDTPTG
ncbi:DUF1127 domain-containing protein [Pararhizobium sp. IMCC21322]|uniref:DUF1127 domain-containing protein n=1 Tax=Pararhizobium sp. IMCC21322 TaxID=3067903 RepID=UPI002741CBE2|nr:DUF1127 domain-containing protein [Pararhizobium sp. IMCC21322]